MEQLQANVSIESQDMADRRELWIMPWHSARVCELPCAVVDRCSNFNVNCLIDDHNALSVSPTLLTLLSS
jgi:hypothetical protein